MKQLRFFSIIFSLLSVVTVVAEIELPENLLPRGFYKEGGAGASSVAVGSKNGRMVAAHIAAGKVSFFNQDTMKENPWEPHVALGVNGKKLDQFKAISIANDGSVYALGADGAIVYCYLWPRDQASVTMPTADIEKRKGGRWVSIACETSDVHFKHISAGSYKQVWALAENGDVYRLQDDIFKRFQLKKGITCAWLSAGLDGTVVFVTPKAKSYIFKDETWFRFSAAPALSKIAVATKRLMWGLAQDKGTGWRKLWKFENGSWMPVLQKDKKQSCPFTDVSVNAAGSVFALGAQGEIYANGERGVPITFVQSMVRGK